MKNGQKTTCPSGHPYSKENTRVSGGRRKCLMCEKARDSVRYQGTLKAQREQIQTWRAQFARERANGQGEMKHEHRPETQEVINKIRRLYTLSAPAELVVEALGRNYDAFVDACEIRDREGLMLPNGKPHPACAIAARAHSDFLAGLNYLALDAIPEDFTKQ